MANGQSVAGRSASAHTAAASAHAAGASATGPLPQPTGADLQTMMAMMMQQNQAILNLTAAQQQTAQTPQATAATPGSPMTQQSPLAKAVDLRGMLKCEEFSGNKEGFQDWKRTFYSTVDLVNPQWAVKAKSVEKDLEMKVPLSSMTMEERADASGLYTFLLHLCKADAATRIAGAEEYNGFEAWRLLCRAYLA